MTDYQIIKTKYGITAGVVPPGLTTGELAVNIADAILFVGGTAGNAIPIVSGGTGGGGGSGVGGFTYSSTPPVSPTVGYRWIDADTGKEYVWVSDGTSDQWIQPMVDSVVGATGATGPLPTNFVQSFNGATGVVSFVNFVSSVNGETGSVTNVARTNQGNTFSVRQVMNAGITASDLFVSGGATFNGVVGFADGSTQNTAYLPSNYGPKITDWVGGITQNIIINPHGTVATGTSNTVNLGTTGGYRMFLHPFFFGSGATISRIVTMQGGAASTSGHTGALKFVVYGTNLNSGLPFRKIYESSSLNLTSTDFQRFEAVPSVRINPGTYWIGFIMDMTPKVGLTYSWSVITNSAAVWEDYQNRFFSNNNLSHLRYTFSSMTLGNTLEHGFTAALAHSATVSASPAVGFGTSEMHSSSRSPWVGVAIQQ